MRSNIYWKAIYNDGTELSQYEEDGTENKYPDIDRSKLASFEIRKAGLVGPNYEKDKLLFKMFLEPGRRLIYRRRVLKKMKVGGTPTGIKIKKRWNEIVYLVGWQATIGDRNVQDIAYIFEDEHVELAGRWMKEPYGKLQNPLPCETQCYNEKHFSVDTILIKEKIESEK